MKEDVETRTIDVNVQAAEVSKDEQVLCADDNMLMTMNQKN